MKIQLDVRYHDITDALSILLFNGIKGEDIEIKISSMQDEVIYHLIFDDARLKK